MYLFTLVLLTQLIDLIQGQSWSNQGADQWSRDYGYFRQRVNPNVCSYETCRLPKCFCAGKDAPRKMDPSVLPQIVMFTFDDAVNEQVYDYYTELFPDEIVNPNGCPATITFFVSHNWTDYGMVKKLYDRGHEIASHSITHRMPQSWWRYGPAEDWEMEIQGQRKNIAQKASIPIEEIRGMRAPFLDTGGDEQFKMLQKHGFEYDASFMTGPHDKGGAWPFTLNYVPSWEYCTNLNCPKEKHRGIWEVPLNRWVGIDGNGCSMVDACQQQPRHKGETLAYLWQNFNRHYYGNRSPVGVNMHATWFKTDHHFEAMKEFVQTISDMDDVYIINVHQTLEWMKSPQTIDRVINFRPWLNTCKGSSSRRVSDTAPALQNIEIDPVAVNTVDAKELTGNSPEFENSVMYIERMSQRPVDEEYNFIDRSNPIEEPNFRSRQVERTNIQIPINVEGEIIQDYRFTERRTRPLPRSDVINNQYTDRRLRPVDNTEMVDIQQNRDQIHPEDFQRHSNNVITNPKVNSEIDSDDTNDIVINEIPVYEDESVFKDIKVESKIQQDININTNSEFKDDYKTENMIHQNSTKSVSYQPNGNEFESYISYDTDSTETDVRIQNQSGNIEIDLKKNLDVKVQQNINKDVNVDVSSSDSGISSTTTVRVTKLTAKDPPRISQKSPPIRQRIRPNRPRLGGIPGRSDLQSRQRNRAHLNSASTTQLNMITIVTSGTIAVLYYQQATWL